jgi:GNAT superfamily N-acetyltransferase
MSDAEGGTEFHSSDDAGAKTDAHLHEPILDGGDHGRAMRAWLNAGDHGMDPATLLTLYGHEALGGKLKPVDGDPFGGKFTPVDHDPFATASTDGKIPPVPWKSFSERAPAPLLPGETPQGRKVTDAIINSVGDPLLRLGEAMTGQGVSGELVGDVLGAMVPGGKLAAGGVAAGARALTKGVDVAAQRLPDSVLSALTLMHRVHGPDAARETFFSLPVETQHRILSARVGSAEAREAQTRHMTDALGRSAADPDYASRWRAAHQSATDMPNRVQQELTDAMAQRSAERRAGPRLEDESLEDYRHRTGNRSEWPSDLPEPGPVERGNPTGFNAPAPTASEAHKRLLKEYLGLEPNQFKGRVQHYEDGGFHLEGELRDPKANEPIGWIEREVNPGDREAQHKGLSLRPQFRNSGISNEILRHNIDWYRNNGIDNVNVFAASQDGGYHWARTGFVPTKEGFSGWDKLRKRVGNDLDSLHATYGLPDNVHAEAKAILADPDPRAIWRLADMRHPVSGGSYGSGQAKPPIPLGARLLSGERWDGNFDVNDPDVLTRFNAYHAYVKGKAKKP